MKHCQHTIGWCSIKNNSMFIEPSGNIRHGFNRTKYGYKIIFMCNNPLCNAQKDVYFNSDGTISTMGKITMR